MLIKEFPWKNLGISRFEILFLILTLDKLNLLPRGNKWGNKKELPDNYEKVLGLIRDNPNITKTQIAKELHIGKSTVDRAIESLKSHGLIERIGSKKSGYWKAME